MSVKTKMGESSKVTKPRTSTVGRGEGGIEKRERERGQTRSTSESWVEPAEDDPSTLPLVSSSSGAKCTNPSPLRRLPEAWKLLDRPLMRTILPPTSVLHSEGEAEEEEEATGMAVASEVPSFGFRLFNFACCSRFCRCSSRASLMSPVEKEGTDLRCKNSLRAWISLSSSSCCRTMCGGGSGRTISSFSWKPPSHLPFCRVGVVKDRERGNSGLRVITGREITFL